MSSIIQSVVESDLKNNRMLDQIIHSFTSNRYIYNIYSIHYILLSTRDYCRFSVCVCVCVCVCGTCMHIYNILYIGLLC